ncbi:aspartic peptidase domain-containing protein [Lactarius indigo]|nr:aspartic peptidase domain-containing protein [Lactarius indigo]
MLSRHLVFVYISVRCIVASPTSSAGLPEPVLPPESSPDSLGIFNSSYAERESRAGDYLAGIGLNPDDVMASGSFNASSFPPPGITDGAPSAASDTYDDPNVISGRGTDPSQDYETRLTQPLQDYVAGALDLLYYGPISIGTPPQVLTVDTCQACHSHQFSPAAQFDIPLDQRELFHHLRTGTGNVSGRLVTDIVTIAGLSVADLAFGTVSARSDEMDKQPNDGLTWHGSHRATFFESLIAQRKLAAPLFSVHLSRHEESGSSVCFGCVDSSRTTGPVTWLPVVSRVSKLYLTRRFPFINTVHY